MSDGKKTQDATMDELLKWVVRLSKPDLAIALLGIPIGAAVDAWLFPGGVVDPFSTGVYFCATAIGAKYSVESVRAWRRRRARRRQRQAAENTRPKTHTEAAQTLVSMRGRIEITKYLNVVISALNAQDDRYPGDRTILQRYKENLENRRTAWEAGDVADAEIVDDIHWTVEKYNDVTSSRENFEQQRRRRSGEADATS